MVVLEKDVGITDFLGLGHASFSAVVKAKVSDFIVNEVASDGTVVTLTSAPVPDKNQTVRPPETAAEKTPALPASDAEWDMAYAGLAQDVGNGGSDIAKSIREFVALGTGSAAKPLVLPPLADKKARRAVHAWAKVNVPTYVTDTVDSEAGKGCIRLRPLQACRPWKRRRTDKAEHGPDRDRNAPKEANKDAMKDSTYDPRNVVRKNGGGAKREQGHGFVNSNQHVQFVLWKSGKDTMNALQEVSSRLRVNVNVLSHAGTKDKRAITTQRVRVRGVPFYRLEQMNASLLKTRGRHLMAVGNFELVRGAQNKPLMLGDLGGNRFTLALRELDLRAEGARANVFKAVASVRERGFINYFGLQRFGSGTFGTHDIGYAVLRNDYEKACRRILTPVVIAAVASGEETLHEDRKKIEEALRGFLGGTIDAQDLLPELPNWMNLEKSLATSFAEKEFCGKERDYEAAFDKLPRSMKTMYGHAVQSHLWNLMASVRVQESRKPFAIAGDVVMKERHSRSRSLNCDTKVRSVTAEEAAAGSIPLDNVLIPVIGTKVPVPENVAGRAAQAVLDKEKLNLKEFHNSHKSQLVGTYRWLIARPTDVTAEIVTYNDRDDRILPSTVADLLGEKKHTGHGNGEGATSMVTRKEDNGKEADLVSKSDTANASSSVKKPDGGNASDTIMSMVEKENGVKQVDLVSKPDAASAVDEVRKADGVKAADVVMQEAGEVVVKPGNASALDEATKLGEGDASKESVKTDGNRTTNDAAIPEGVEATGDVMKPVDTSVGEVMKSVGAKAAEEVTSPNDRGASEEVTEPNGVGANTEVTKPDSGGSTGEMTASDGRKADKKVDNTGSSETSDRFHALVLSFTLGTSEYATMLIRELTKQDSSVANQKALQKVAENRDEKSASIGNQGGGDEKRIQCRTNSSVVTNNAASDKPVDAVVNEPSADAIVGEPSADAIVGEPSADAIVGIPSADAVVKKSSTITVANGPSADGVAKVPSTGEVSNNPSADGIPKEPSTSASAVADTTTSLIPSSGV